ncbi:hypothetical protein DPMN_194648 [Dreissena polymorpha]|uniref:Uncharacterized protein n=1 Tax=Dreissena polymorpha TaxID=45954 RepID=A0A9D3XXJ3_DREPO|nr:hypothetical protein DPMN_194648 [Dreissena polymorpha]
MKSKRKTRKAHSRRSSSSGFESRSWSLKDEAKNSRKYDNDGSSHKRSSRRQGDPRKHP